MFPSASQQRSGMNAVMITSRVASARVSATVPEAEASTAFCWSRMLPRRVTRLRDFSRISSLRGTPPTESTGSALMLSIDAYPRGNSSRIVGSPMKQNFWSFTLLPVRFWRNIARAGRVASYALPASEALRLVDELKRQLETPVDTESRQVR